jgi:hypothetical protein
MPLQRDNDQERAAIIDRLLQQQDRRHPARAVRPGLERRQHRSETELRTQREEMKCEWDAQNGSKTHQRSA